MATNTNNYNLKKPAKTDFYNVDDFNDNMDVIDINLKKIDDKAKLISINVTLQVSNWTLNELTNYYEYNVVDANVTRNTYVEVLLDIENQLKMSTADVNSYDGGFVIRTVDLPEENVNITYLCKTVEETDEEVI